MDKEHFKNKNKLLKIFKIIKTEPCRGGGFSFHPIFSFRLE
jgi:hypothetical protein